MLLSPKPAAVQRPLRPPKRARDQSLDDELAHLTPNATQCIKRARVWNSGRPTAVRAASPTLSFGRKRAKSPNYVWGHDRVSDRVHDRVHRHTGVQDIRVVEADAAAIPPTSTDISTLMSMDQDLTVTEVDPNIPPSSSTPTVTSPEFPSHPSTHLVPYTGPKFSTTRAALTPEIPLAIYEIDSHGREIPLESLPLPMVHPGTCADECSASMGYGGHRRPRALLPWKEDIHAQVVEANDAAGGVQVHDVDECGSACPAAVMNMNSCNFRACEEGEDAMDLD